MTYPHLILPGICTKCLLAGLVTFDGGDLCLLIHTPRQNGGAVAADCSGSYQFLPGQDHYYYMSQLYSE